MTLPQIIMLNHAASVSSARFDERYERKKKREQHSDSSGIPRQNSSIPEPSVNGKKLTEMNSAEWGSYFNGFGG